MSAKYRHQGYQDSDREPEQGSRPRPAPVQNLTPEERIQLRSLRRATAREATEVLRCHNCGRSVQDFGTIVADTVCPSCAAPLHCCRTCVHFDTSSRWQCRAAIPVAIPAKSEANTCVEYRSRLVLDATGRRSPSSGSPGSPQSSDPRAQFENLFKR